MLDINKLKNNPFFKEKKLKSEEILFNEGDINNNLYIVLSGELKVEKGLRKGNSEKKTLNYLKKDDVFGEGSLSQNGKKEVSIKAKTDSCLLYINSENFEKFVENDTKFGVKTLIGIIELLNKRLLESNSLLITSYNIRKAISEKKDFSNKNLFSVVDNFLKEIDVDFILLLEQNPIMKGYYKLVYDTRKQGKMLAKIININSDLNEDILKENDVSLEKNNYIIELGTKIEKIGYLVFGKNKDFSESEKNSAKSFGRITASFIEERQKIEEEKYERVGLYN